jgi:hypothetical protein
MVAGSDGNIYTLTYSSSGSCTEFRLTGFKPDGTAHFSKVLPGKLYFHGGLVATNDWLIVGDDELGLQAILAYTVLL